jgi:hypothetical protein
MICWARRLHPERSNTPEIRKIRYVNQSVAHGAHWDPFNLGAIRRAVDGGLPRHIVEGPVTALGSESLRDGNATPTIAMLARVGFDKMISHVLSISSMPSCPISESSPASTASMTPV